MPATTAAAARTASYADNGGYGTVFGSIRGQRKLGICSTLPKLWREFSRTIIPAMSLAEYITENIESLLDDWVDLASNQLPAADSMGMAALRNGARSIMLAIAADMQSYQSDTEQEQKALGERPANAPAITITARNHAIQRFDHSFTLKQLMAEYRALRASVIRHWTRQLDEVGPDELQELIRFGEAVDQSLIEAADLFNERANEAGEIFVGILGHDLRNPLNAALSGNTLQGLLDDTPEQRHEINERVTSSLNRMTEMINGMADFARTRLGGELPISCEETDLGQNCREAVALFHDSHPERKIEVDLEGPLTGYWDAGRLMQLSSNLIVNALNYGAEDTTITVAAKADGDDVLLSVHNFGPAIEPDMQSRIFDPMVRGNPASEDHNRSAESMGLGLYAVRAIARAHGGEVSVSSSEQDGTTFTVSLPKGRSE